MSSDGTLHWEILTDVLSRLPVKSLCRFKSVSPSWNSLISDTYFAKTHLNRTKTLKNPKHLYQNEIIMSYHKVHNLYSVDFAGVNPTITKLDFPTMAQHDAAAVTVRGSCDGLLLASLHVLSNLFLLNPSTKECNKLPLPPSRGPVLWMRGSLHGLGYDSSTDDYKVVLIIYCYRTVWDRSDDCDVTVVNVYSLRTNAWRRIKNTDYYRLKENSGGVFFKGCIHGLCWRDGSKVMVAFDLSDEIFREVPLPASFSWCGISRYDVAVLGGCLCLVDGRQTEVWMMKEYGVRESWTEFTIRSGFRTANLLCLLAEDGFFLRTTGEKLKHLVEYNQKKDSARDMVVCGVPPRFSFEGIYVESLISPHHRRGIERQ